MTTTVDQFEILKHIGSGAYGEVLNGSHSVQIVRFEVAAVRKIGGKDSGIVYAMKAMDKKRMGKHRDMVEHEFKLLITVKSPFLMKMVYSFQTNRQLVFVLPLAGGGDMLTLVERGCLDENHAKFYICELIEGVGCLHSKQILHRDIKLENLLIGNDGHLLITDYGLCATGCDSAEAVEGLFGTRHVMAPEIHLGKKYGLASDWWSVGITYCDMRSSKALFEGEESKDYCDNAARKRPKLPKELSDKERGFINRLIARDPAQRLGGGANGVLDVKAHNFFKDVNWSDVLAKKVTPPFIPTTTQLESLEFFPEQDAKHSFPEFQPNAVPLYWDNIEFTAADLQ